MAAQEGARILVVDDQPHNLGVLVAHLEPQGYVVEAATNGDQALEAIERHAPDLVLLDIVMPGKSGLEVCRRLRMDPRFATLPIVLVTALDPDTERIKGLEAGADDFITKPINAAELVARVRSLLRVKRLFDQTQTQAAELARLNQGLEALVAAKVAEIERLSKLKRFLAPQLAQRIVAGDAGDPLVSHRRDIVVVFFDLRGFTAFAERQAPEDVMAVLREFHQVVGEQVTRFGGTIERYAGDGVMVFFNDPEPLAEPCAEAARFACAVLAACRDALGRWRSSGFGLDLSSGIAYGYATLGGIGYGDRIDYGAIGGVTNLAARLCAEAKGGEILISARAASALPPDLRTEPAGQLALKGFRDPVDALRLFATEAAKASA